MCLSRLPESKHAPVASKASAVNSSLVPVQYSQRLARFRVPKANRAVRPATGQEAPVRAERDRLNRAGMTAQGRGLSKLRQSARDQSLTGCVRTARGQPAAIGAESDVLDRRRMRVQPPSSARRQAPRRKRRCHRRRRSPAYRRGATSAPAQSSRSCACPRQLKAATLSRVMRG